MVLKWKSWKFFLAPLRARTFPFLCFHHLHSARAESSCILFAQDLNKKRFFPFCTMYQNLWNFSAPVVWPASFLSERSVGEENPRTLTCYKKYKYPFWKIFSLALRARDCFFFHHKFFTTNRMHVVCICVRTLVCVSFSTQPWHGMHLVQGIVRGYRNYTKTFN